MSGYTERRRRRRRHRRTLYGEGRFGRVKRELLATSGAETRDRDPVDPPGTPFIPAPYLNFARSKLKERQTNAELQLFFSCGGPRLRLELDLQQEILFVIILAGVFFSPVCCLVCLENFPTNFAERYGIFGCGAAPSWEQISFER